MKRYLFILGLLLTLGSTLQIRAQGDDYNPELPAEPNQRYKLSLVASPGEAAYVSGSGWYKEGTSAWVSTSAWSPNYTFVHWKKGNEIISTERSFNYTVTTSETLVAVYEFTPEAPSDPTAIHEHRLYLQCSPSDACSFNRTSGAKVTDDEYVYISAYLSPGFLFRGWYQGAVKISDVKDFNYLMGNENVTLTMRCEYAPTTPGDPAGGQGNVANTELGDVNEDGSVDTADAVLIINKYLGNDVVMNTTVADMNSDGVIDTADAVLIINKYLNK